MFLFPLSKSLLLNLSLFGEKRMENSLLLDLHKRVGLLLQDLDESEVEEPRWDGLAELHAELTRYLLSCGFQVEKFCPEEHPMRTDLDEYLFNSFVERWCEE